MTQELPNVGDLIVVTIGNCDHCETIETISGYVKKIHWNSGSNKVFYLNDINAFDNRNMGAYTKSNVWEIHWFDNKAANSKMTSHWEENFLKDVISNNHRYKYKIKIFKPS